MNPLELWYTEAWQEDTRFSIQVKAHLHHEKTAYQQIDFFDSDTFGRFFTLDGLIMVTEKDEFAYHDMITHVAMAVNPDIRRVLIIGGGDGGTAREVARYPQVECIDMVEIDERVVRLCQVYLPVTAGILDQDPRVRLYFQDGVRFIENTPSGTYDLILVDSTDPIGPGEGLFSVDFYKHCYQALTAQGILVNQHESPYFSNYRREMFRAHDKLKKTFPVARVYQFHMPSYPSGHWLFGFASKGPEPVRDHKKEQWEALGIHTRYYNSSLHQAAFALPTYVWSALYEEERA